MKKIFLTFLAAAFMLVFASCDKTNDGNGRLVVNITDAPFPVDMVESAEVTITKLEIRKAGDGISDECPFEVIWEGSEIFNLLDDKAAYEELMSKIGGNFKGVPVTDIDGEVVLGFDRPKIDETLQEKGLVKA